MSHEFSKQAVVGWLMDHERAWNDCCNYFDIDEEDAITGYMLDNIIDWISDHDGLLRDMLSYFTSFTREELDTMDAEELSNLTDDLSSNFSLDIDWEDED